MGGQIGEVPAILPLLPLIRIHPLSRSRRPQANLGAKIERVGDNVKIELGAVETRLGGQIGEVKTAVETVGENVKTINIKVDGIWKVGKTVHKRWGELLASRWTAFGRWEELSPSPCHHCLASDMRQLNGGSSSVMSV